MNDKKKKIIKIILVSVMILSFTAFVVGAVVTLATPNARIVGDMLYISPSADAEGYRVYVDGTLKATLSNDIYTVTGNITHGSLYGGNSQQIQAGKTLSISIIPDSNYIYPSSVTVSGALYSYNANTGVVSLSNATGNITITAVCPHAPFVIQGNLLNLTEDANADLIIYDGGTATYSFNANSGYTCPTFITVNGVTGSSGNVGVTWTYVYSSNSSYVQLSNPTQNITISAQGVAVPVTYTLGNTMSNVTITGVEINGVSNGTTIPQSVSANDEVIITFTANSNYTLPTSITVNGYTVPENTATATYGNCVADYSTYNGTGTITLTSFTGNITVLAVGTSVTPTTYTIPAGTYYGKANPTLPQSQTFCSIDFSCDSGDVYFVTICFETTRITYSMDGEIQWTPAFEFGEWQEGNYLFRTITVSYDTTVTQAEYEAFFNCFDYAFALHATGTDYSVYYGFTPLGMTWQEFVESPYNDGHFRIENDYVIYDRSAIYYYVNDHLADSPRSSSVISTLITYIYTGGGSN